MKFIKSHKNFIDTFIYENWAKIFDKKSSSFSKVNLIILNIQTEKRPLSVGVASGFK